MIVYLLAWIAAGGFFAAWIAPPESLWRRRLWTAGWFCYLLHVAAAFQFVYHWNHAAAVNETSLRAVELTGSPAPHAIYYNHAFTLLWTLDIAWLWLAPQSYRRRPRRIAYIVYGYLLFIVVNATIVFVDGSRRWLGIAGLAIAAAAVGLRQGIRQRR